MKHRKRLLALLLSLCILCPASLPAALAVDQPTDPPPNEEGVVTEQDTSKVDSSASNENSGTSKKDTDTPAENPGTPDPGSDTPAENPGTPDNGFVTPGQDSDTSETDEDRPAVKKLQSIELPKDKDVPIGTSQEDLDLPGTLNGVLVDGTEVKVPVIWASDDYDEETIGTYTITAEIAPDSGYELETDEELTVEVTVELEAVPLKVSSEFAEIQERWKDYLIGGLDDADDKDIAAYIKGINDTANGWYNTLNKENDRTTEPELLWNELTMNTGYGGAKQYGYKDTSNPARDEFNTVRKGFERLLPIVEAYSIEGCDLYREDEVLNEILSAYDLLVEKYYNADSMLYGNWYSWEIAIPQAFLQALIILGDEVPAEKLGVYLAAVERYVPSDNTTGATTGILTSPKVMTGANLLDKASSSAMIAMLKGDSARMEECRENVTSILKYSNNTNPGITSGDDGFWKDGSYIQHEGIAYTGGYGATLYRQLGIFQYMFYGSTWDFSDVYAESPVFDSIFEGVEPLLYNGHFMDMVAGRGIARKAENDVTRTAGILSALIPYVETLPTDEMNDRLKSMLKYHLEKVETEYFGSDDAAGYVSCANALVGAKELLSDSSIEDYDGMERHKSYPSMDKAVHAMGDYAFALSMHSPRIFNHEFINNEGKRSWNISDGMTYLYLDDNQYGEGYWATVDPRRLPGTTSEFVMRGDGVGQDKANPFAEVGMTELDGFGVAGMHLKTLGNGDQKDGTEAKKSWFMFDDEIVALGSGITSDTGNAVETIVENRRIDENAADTITVNGTERPDVLDNSSDDGGGDDNHYVRIRDYEKANGASGKSGELIYNLGDQNIADQFVIEAKLRFRVKDAPEKYLNWGSIRVLGGSNKAQVYLFTTNGGKIRRRVEAAADGVGSVQKDVDVGAYKAGEWLSVKITVNQTDKTYTVALDGETKGTYPWANGATEGQLTQLKFTTQGNNSDDGDVEIDDVKIYAAESENSPIVNEDFESASDLPSGWTKTENTGITVTVTSDSQSPNQGPKGTTINDVSAIHLSGEEGTEIGYYFPGSPAVKVLKEVRTGDWNDVGPNEGEVTNGYATIAFDHGVRPSGASYAYAILPNFSNAETTAYASNPDFQIISQSSVAHVVKDASTGITGGFFWKANSTPIGGFTVSAPAAVMMKEDGDRLEFAIADPTQSADTLTITCSAEMKKSSLKCDDGVKVINYAPLTIEINTKESYGKTFCLSGTGSVIEAEEDEFDELRQRWYYQIAGSNDFDENDPDITSYIKTLNYYADDALSDLAGDAKNAETYQQFYDAFTSADMVFNKQPMKHSPGASNNEKKSHSSQVTMTYDRLKRLALGYLTKGTQIYNSDRVLNAILAAMDFMYDTDKYSPRTAEEGGKPNDHAPFGNWWDWEIGTSLRYLDLQVLMYEKLTPEQIEHFTGAVKFYLTDAKEANNWTGANKIWMASILAENAILMKDQELLESVLPLIHSELRYVTSGDGFYEDGSFVQHNNFAYTGGYGKALLVTLAPLMNVVKGTKYEISYDDGAEKIFYDAIFKSYIPVIINGAIMDMVRCREISRIGGQDHVSGREVIRSIISMTNLLEGEQQQQARAMVKYYMQQDDSKQIFSDYDISEFFLEYYVTLAHILDGKKILADSSIKAAEPLTGYYNFAGMARVVQRLPDHSFGLAMHGGQIQTFEVTNTEGTNCWHTADGMLYLYNTDKEKYADNFWGTVDHQRLPGTTVDRWNKTGEWRSKTSNAVDAAAYGGAQIFGKYGATAFQVNNNVSSNKSYFFFDDEAVMLGSGISSTSGNPAETIVENYKAKLDLSNRVSVDGTEQTRSGSSDSFNGKHENVKYIHMEGNVSGADVGYVFPGGADVTGLRETRTQKWTLMNNYEKFKDDRDVTNSFITMYLEHGTNPTDEEYAYAILPGKSETETAAYSADADVEILENSKTVHAVRENTLGLTAVNFFTAGNCAAADVSADKPVSVIYGTDQQGNLTTVSVADVTNKATGTVTVTLGRKAVKDVSDAEGITVQTGEDSTILTVDLTGTRGQTRNITFAETVESVTALTDISVAYGTAQERLPLPETVTVTLSDGSTREVSVGSWKSSTYNASQVGTYDFTGTLELPDDIINPQNLTAAIQVTVKRQSRPNRPSGSGSGSSSGSSTSKDDKEGAQTPAKTPETSGSKPAETPPVRYNDVSAGDWYQNAVDYVTRKGIMSGNNSNFMPNDALSRGMIAQILYNIEGGRGASPAAFADVKANDWFAEAVSWVSANNVMKGYSSGAFGPNDSLTREQLAVTLYQYASVKGYDLTASAGLSSFVDGDSVSNWAAAAVQWAVANGLISGKSGSRLDPQGTASRAEVAAVLMNFVEHMTK